jgi:hypothetical protein
VLRRRRPSTATAVPETGATGGLPDAGADQGAAVVEETEVPRPERTELDVVYLTDLRFPGGTTTSLVEELRAGAAAGYRIGVLGLRNSRLGTGGLAHVALRRLAAAGTIEILVPGEPVAARLAIVKHPLAFATPLTGRLPIEVPSVLLTAGQVPADRDGTTYYDPVEIGAHVAEALGHVPLWAPVSPVVRAQLTEVPGIELRAEDWVEVIEVAEVAEVAEVDAAGACHGDDAVHGPFDERLVIGRHSRPDPLKWPADADAIRAAYPVDGSVRVRVLGGADPVAAVLGEVPRSWEVLPFGGDDVTSFLGTLDAFVYHHHPDLVEAFGRTVLEALASRTLAVVPPHFAEVFGEACLYAEPHDTIDRIRELRADPDRLAAHLDRASAIVEDRFSHAAHLRRLGELVGPPEDHAPGRAAPRIDLEPPGAGAYRPTVMVVCLGADRERVETVIRAVAEQRGRVGGFQPVVVMIGARPELAARLGVEVRVVQGRKAWGGPADEWPDFAYRRLRQIAAHHRVDSITVDDVTHPDAWIALQLRPRSDDTS